MKVLNIEELPSNKIYVNINIVRNTESQGVTTVATKDSHGKECHIGVILP